ncbi:RNA polymerase sigma factor [Arthrobacter sp. G.S.26]|uniref:RNA polymerase sigma factor n=1 Tax=Micrococcaceae TaxID=1268 RepID=UPI0006832CB1|nr:MULTISPECIES: RNA polymerase sigma factor [Micrococcaceae]
MDETTEPDLQADLHPVPPEVPAPFGAEPRDPANGWDDGVWTPLDELDALTVVSRAQDGDVEAFEWLLNAYQGGLFRLCLRMLDDRTEAEDLVQETFISAWRALPNLTVPQAFVPWLYRTATNKCLDLLRRRKGRPPAGTGQAGVAGDRGDAGQDTTAGAHASIGQGAGADPAKEYENQAQMRALSDLLQTVPPGPRACWLLKEVHEFSYREIAAIVQLPESTVRGRIARAKRFLAEGMEPWR